MSTHFIIVRTNRIKFLKKETQISRKINSLFGYPHADLVSFYFFFKHSFTKIKYLVFPAYQERENKNRSFFLYGVRPIHENCCVPVSSAERNRVGRSGWFFYFEILFLLNYTKCSTKISCLY